MIRIVLLCCILLPLTAFGATEKYRAMWREDPATSMVIGWNQKSGSSPTVYLDKTDYGQDYSRYRFSKTPDHVIVMKGMNNHFVRLKGLQPNTVYYFVIRDNEGVSKRFSFKTAPDNPYERLSIIAGGDSRNNRDVRQDANKLVSKLRPHVVLFNGDMTDGDSDVEWQEWFDDWQLTISGDGRLAPVLVARGNHEVSNTVVTELFDLPNPDAYYALTMGGTLLRIYTLNSMFPAGGPQRQWLESDLTRNVDFTWKIAQYHLSMRPHTAKKPDNSDQYFNWASLFYGFNVNLAIESDAHVAKVTWPVRPSTEAGSSEGFIRDDNGGTVYTGEGGWGAPLRDCNDNKPWTRNSGSFNQFSWIFVDENQMEVRTVRITDADAVMEVDPSNIFRAPLGLSVWNPSNGDVVIIRKQGEEMLASDNQAWQEEAPMFKDDVVVASRQPGFVMQDFSASNTGAHFEIEFSTANEPAQMNYELQRSTDGGATFLTIKQFPGAGNALNYYRHTDTDLANQSRYRLKRIFPSGESDFYFPNRKIVEDLSNYDRLPILLPDASSQTLKVAYTIDQFSNVRIRVVNDSNQEVIAIELPNQAPDKYLKTVDLSALPRGRYMLVVRAGDQPLRRFRVMK